jgi:tRNA (mo5U34)-methyltransferase
MAPVLDVPAPSTSHPPAGAAQATPRGSRARWAMRHMFNALGYSLARKDRGRLDAPAMPKPSDEVLARAAGYFANCFPVSAASGLTEEDIARKVKEFFWHYPFKFGEVFVEADDIHFKGLRGRHYQRYFHIFPPLLSLFGGSLAGKSVLEIGCNAGFWSIQARRAGADSVLGLDFGPRNVEQAKFIRDVIGLDRLEYRVMNAYDVSKEALGDFDVTFFLGLLYHIDRPVEALERLYAVTRDVAVIDTTLARSDVPDGVPMLRVQEDFVHDQNASNRIALVPSKAAVPLLLKHVGFREVFWIRNASRDLPLDYLTEARMTFIARK